MIAPAPHPRRLQRPRSRLAPAVIAAGALAQTALVLTVRPARAEATAPAPLTAISARETAFVEARPGAYSVGVFNPLEIALGRGMSVRAHPLLFFVAPHAVLRVAHVRATDGWNLTGEYGLAVPTWGMRLTQGYLFPSWDRHGGKIGWSFAPSAGVRLSRGRPLDDVFTVVADLTLGVPLGHNDAHPLDTYAPVELVFAPVLRGFRARAGAISDACAGPRHDACRLRVRGYADVYLQGGERDRPYGPGALAPRVDRTSIVVRAGAGVDVGLGATWLRGGGAPGDARAYTKRLTVGLAIYNADLHEIDPETFERHRSTDVFPTLDFIWERW